MQSSSSLYNLLFQHLTFTMIIAVINTSQFETFNLHLSLYFVIVDEIVIRDSLINDWKPSFKIIFLVNTSYKVN